MKNKTFLLLQAKLLYIYQKLHWWMPKQEGELLFVRKYAKSLRFLYEVVLKKIGKKDMKEKQEEEKKDFAANNFFRIINGRKTPDEKDADDENVAGV